MTQFTAHLKMNIKQLEGIEYHHKIVSDKISMKNDKDMKPHRTQRNTLRTLKEYSIRNITQMIVFNKYSYCLVFAMPTGSEL